MHIFKLSLLSFFSLWSSMAMLLQVIMSSRFLSMSTQIMPMSFDKYLLISSSSNSSSSDKSSNSSSCRGLVVDVRAMHPRLQLSTFVGRRQLADNIRFVWLIAKLWRAGMQCYRHRHTCMHATSLPSSHAYRFLAEILK